MALARWLSVVILIPVSAVIAPREAASAVEPRLKVVGSLPSPFELDGSNPDAPASQLVVDATHNIGFSTWGSRHIVMYDLASLTVLDVEEGPIDFAGPTGFAPRSPTPTGWTIDEEHQRVYTNRVLPSGNPCTVFAKPRVHVIDYAPDASGKREILIRTAAMECSGQEGFKPLYLSLDPTSNRLYASGALLRDIWREEPVVAPFAGTQDNSGAGLILRQMDPTTDPMRVEWEVDLRTAGCGRRIRPFVARVGSNVLAYCYDTTTGPATTASGSQGYVVRIPLERRNGVDMPRIEGESEIRDPVSNTILNATIRKTPALPGFVEPIVDPVAGRLFLVSSSSVNGNAVWVFDPKQDRFVGVVTGGFADQPAGNTAVGIDPRRGRAYLLTSNGFVVADTRAEPLRAPSLEPVLSNDNNTTLFVVASAIAVAPALHRVFVPVRQPDAWAGCPDGRDACPRFIVLEDLIPDPPPPLPPPDPDALTSQTDEISGENRSEVSSRALASGAHVVVTGGLSRTASAQDPFCVGVDPEFPDSPLNAAAFEPVVFGRCASELVVSGGHRELFLAATETETGTSGGASARGAGMAFGTNDFASDRDVRNARECLVPNAEGVLSHLASQGGSPPPTSPAPPDFDEDGRDEGACATAIDRLQAESEQGEIPALEGGTRGSDGRGFPVSSAACADFGSRPTASDVHGPGSFRSAVTCRADAPQADAAAQGGALLIPDPDEPQLVIGRTTSSVLSARTPDGQVTTSHATAHSVIIGPLHIGKVQTQAVTVAHGRSGTADTEFAQEWCDVILDGEAVADGCFDPASDANAERLESVNHRLGKIRISVPQPALAASPGGYQAVATKDSALRAADVTMNDDDSFTVAGLQAIVYNDGAEGRNRYVVQLAGVHAESRYGIVELPKFGSPRPSPPSPKTPPARRSAAPGVAPSVMAPVADDGPAARVRGATAAQVEPLAAESPLRRFLRQPLDALEDAFDWIVNNPREAALLFAMWSLLMYPVHLALRRRSFERRLYQRQTGGASSAADLSALAGLVGALTDTPASGRRE